MNDQKPNESLKLIMRENLSSPLSKEKARRLVLNNLKIKNDHIFDKINFLGIPEETNDKSNNYNSNTNLINDSAGELNPAGKDAKKCSDPESNSKREINGNDLSPKQSLVTIKYNHESNSKNENKFYLNNEKDNCNKYSGSPNDYIKFNNENNTGIENKNFSVHLMQRNIRINKSYNFESLNFKNNSNSNYKLNNLKNSANSNSNIYIRNSNINLNSFGENRLSKIYKEDSFNSKKTLEIIKQRKSVMLRKSEITESHSANKSLSPYFETFKEFFKDEQIIKNRLHEIMMLLKANKALEKIKNHLNILDNESGEKDCFNACNEGNTDLNCKITGENEREKEFKLDKNQRKKVTKHSSGALNKKVYTDAETTRSNENDKRKAKRKKSKIDSNNRSNDNSKNSDSSFKRNEFEQGQEKPKPQSVLNKNINKDQTKNNIPREASEKPINNQNHNELEDSKYNDIKTILHPNNLINNEIETYNFKNNNNNNRGRTSSFNFDYFGKSPIGPICEMEKIYFLCQLKNAKSEIAKMSIDLAYWRLVLGDGNCFYRAFIFSLLEIWILQSNLTNLEKLLCDFFEVMESEKNSFLLKQNPFSKLEAGAILLLIINQLRQKNKPKAYEIFLKAYQKFKSFDTALIIYMRLVLFNYISKHKNFYYNSESQIEIGHLLPNEYIDDIGNFQFEDFFNSFLLRMNSEAEKIIIYLSPIIFGVDLDLFILEGLAKAKYAAASDGQNHISQNGFNDNDDYNKLKNINLNAFGDNLNFNDNSYKNDNAAAHSLLLNDNKNNLQKNEQSGIKLLLEHFPCYRDEYLIRQENKNDVVGVENIELKSNRIVNNKISDHPSSRNKVGLPSDSNHESANFNNYFNSKMLMTIRENEDGFENNNEEKEAEVLLANNEILKTYVNCTEENANLVNRNNRDNDDINDINKEIDCNTKCKETDMVDLRAKNEKEFNTISLLYRSAHYDKVYTKAFTEHFRNFDFKNSDYFIFNSKEDLFSDRKIEAEESFCSPCDKNMKKISFKHLKESGFIHCQICLIDIINTVFKQRVKSFVEENYNNLEYYCRPIKIDNERDWELYDQDIMSLYRESIHQHFIRLIENTCLGCFNKYEDFHNDFVFFNCRCKICKFCVIDKIKNLTEGKFVLNNFEKRKILSTFYIDCVCSNKIEVNYALHNTLNDSELFFWERKAEERFKEVVKRHCLNCKNLIKIKSEKQKKKSKEKQRKKNKDLSKNNNKNNTIDNNTLDEKEFNNNNNNNNKSNKFLNVNQKQNFRFVNSEKNCATEDDKEKEYNLSYNKNSYVKYYSFPIIPQQNKVENPIDESFDPHLICDLCVDIVNQEILNKIRLRSNKGKKEVFRIVEIKCILCLKEHNVEYKNFKKFVRTGFQRCCSVL